MAQAGCGGSKVGAKPPTRLSHDLELLLGHPRATPINAGDDIDPPNPRVDVVAMAGTMVDRRGRRCPGALQWEMAGLVPCAPCGDEEGMRGRMRAGSERDGSPLVWRTGMIDGDAIS